MSSAACQSWSRGLARRTTGGGGNDEREVDDVGRGISSRGDALLGRGHSDTRGPRRGVGCTGVTDTEGSVSIDVVIGIPRFPAMASNGDLKINGNPNILGPCGGADANNVVIVSGTPTVQTQISASDSVEVTGHINQAGGGESTPLNHQPPVEIPDLSRCNSTVSSVNVGERLSKRGPRGPIESAELHSEPQIRHE